MAGLQSVAQCRGLEYFSMGVGVAFKAAQTCAAVDQFVAVKHPLQHYSIMIRARPLLFAGTWLTCGVQLVLGLVAHFLHLQTFAERAESLGSNVTYTGCRWETGLAYFSTIFIEVEMVAFSLATASLLVYTGVVGYRMKRKLMRRDREVRRNDNSGEDSNKAFLDNYRAFKKIMAVLSLTVTLDIVAPILRISSRWYPQPTLNGLVHMSRIFCFIFEGWAYGLLNAELRAAYRKTLCGRSNRVADPEVTRSAATHRSRQEAQPAVAVVELQSVNSADIK